MRIYALRFLAGDAELSFDITSRDANLLSGPPPFMPGGQQLLSALGVLGNWSVARGIPKGSKSVRKRLELRLSAEAFRSSIDSYIDLLSFDYSYAFPQREKDRCKGLDLYSFRVRGLHGRLTRDLPDSARSRFLSNCHPAGIGTSN